MESEISRIVIVKYIQIIQVKNSVRTLLQLRVIISLCEEIERIKKKTLGGIRKSKRCEENSQICRNVARKLVKVLTEEDSSF